MALYTWRFFRPHAAFPRLTLHSRPTPHTTNRLQTLFGEDSIAITRGQRNFPKHSAFSTIRRRTSSGLPKSPCKRLIDKRIFGNADDIGGDPQIFRFICAATAQMSLASREISLSGNRATLCGLRATMPEQSARSLDEKISDRDALATHMRRALRSLPLATAQGDDA